MDSETPKTDSWARRADWFERHAMVVPSEISRCMERELREARREIARLSQPREHTASADCWCQPEADYVDPESGATVYVHKGVQ